jgi:hypothetical protein
MPYIDSNFTQRWIFANGGIQRNITAPTASFNIFYRNSTPVQYKQNKNYQFITGASLPDTNRGFTIKYTNPFPTATASIIRSNPSIAFGGIGTFSDSRVVTYASPNSSISTIDVITYAATSTNGLTGSSVIKSTILNEIDFYINGYRTVVDGLTGSSNTVDRRGWYYDYVDDSYKWYYSGGVSLASGPTFSSFGNGIGTVYSGRNYIAKRIEYDYFNMQFDYATGGGNPTDGVGIYLGTTLNNPNTWQLVGELSGVTQSVRHQLFGLTGTNVNGSKNFLIFSASQSSTDFILQLSNINIYGGYHPSNNQQFLFTNTSNYQDPEPLQIIGATSATYSFVVGWGSTILGTFSTDIQNIKAKFGNGTFKAGIWENGVWNSGWRVDTEVKEFDDISISITSRSDVKWRIQITGSEESTSYFKIGDNISLGNIVAVDINENRKLLKGSFRIIAKTNNSIIVETNTTFPYRRIQKDSPNHKIKVTKNIWLSGAFLNGYFTGIWNYGLFKGYPEITEMFNTHWVDGIFDGGHYHSRYPSYNFNDTYYIVASNWGLDSSFEGKLGLTFSNGHEYLEGDYIFIDKNNKNINPEYDTITKVIKVIDSKLIVTDLSFGSSTNNESGKTTRYTSTGVIQNFKFYDNNRSRLTSNQSKLSTDVFSFNSWIDVNYDDTRSVTISRRLNIFDNLAKKIFNKNNLYGYPTYDVLSSESFFRNSHNLETKSYKLGTKYKIFEDFIGSGSEFTEPFEPQIFTDQIILSIDRLVAPSPFGMPFEPGVFSITVVPINTDPYNFTASVSPITICQVTEVTNSTTMTTNIKNAIGSGYTASSNGNILTITDLNSNSFNVNGIIIDSTNYGLKFAGAQFGGTRVIYPEQEITDTKPIKFGRLTEGVGYEYLNENGWKFNSVKYSDVDVRRTQQSETNDLIEGEEMLVTTINDGVIFNNDRIKLENSRYSIVEFDVLDFEINSLNYIYDNPEVILRGFENSSDVELPVLHFSNLNYELFKIQGFSLQYLPSTYLPVYQNINHLVVENTFRLDSEEETSAERWGGFGRNRPTKKYEYFYGKKDLMMKILGNGFKGASSSSITLDNIKLYEVDMIPFFQYFTEQNIYKGVQVPYQAVAPFIDYSNSNFVFLDNINIGLDSVDTQNSFEPISGVGAGIGSPIGGSPIFVPPDSRS